MAYKEPDNVVASDTDGDGIVDSRDACPNTPSGVPVNPAGCAMDTDRDGVADNRDECAGTPAGTQVNRQGCEVVEIKSAYFAIESAVLSDYAKGALDTTVAMLARDADIVVHNLTAPRLERRRKYSLPGARSKPCRMR